MLLRKENIALVAAALCVVTLGFVSVSHRHVTRSELLVGSTFVNPSAIPSHSYGYGNEAAAQPHGIEDVGTNIVFHGVHNEGGVHGARKVQTKKGLVGSYNVNQMSGQKPTRTMGFGNEAAASPHGIEDVGTNIVFHGVHNEGGVHGARKVQTKKGLVGSYSVGEMPGQVPHSRSHPPRGYGNEAGHGGPGFYNAAHKKRQALAVGSFVVGDKPGEVSPQRAHPPHGYGNQAGSGGPGFYNAAHKKPQALAVGSFVVGDKPGEVSPQRAHPPHGYGNQAGSGGAGFYNSQ